MAVSERRICLLCNNVDFKINTRDSKNEFHKIGIAVYRYLKNNEGNLSNLRKRLEKVSNQGDHIFMELLNQVISLRPLMENCTSNSYRKQINFVLHKLWDSCCFLLRGNDSYKKVATWQEYCSISDQSMVTFTKHCVLSVLYGTPTD